MKWVIFIGLFLVVIILIELVLLFYYQKPTDRNNTATNNTTVVKTNTNLLPGDADNICLNSNNNTKFSGISLNSTPYQLDNKQVALDIEGCLTDVSEANGKVVLSVAFFDDKLKEHTYKFEAADSSSFTIWTGDTYITTKNNQEIIAKIKDKGVHIKMFSVIDDPQKIYVNSDPQSFRAFTKEFISALNSKNNYPEPLYNIPIIGIGF